jgi:hypothetical protein
LSLGRLSLLNEVVLQSDYRRNESGGFYECPRCGAVLTATPGRVRCTSCPFEALHEHTLNSVDENW